MTEFSVRIIQPNVPSYRVALYESLSKHYGDRLEVLATDGVGTPNVSQPLRGVRYDYSHPIRKIGPLGWQKGVSLDGMRRGDVLVVCGNIQTLSNVWLAICAKARGVAVIWWGHHRSATSTEKRTRIRLLMARMLSDVFLCYTQSGVDFLRERGFRPGRVFATWNTIDQEPIKQAIREWDEKRLRAFRAQRGLAHRPILLICSALRVKTRLDLLIRAMSDARLAALNAVLAIIGEGPMEASCRQLAKDLGVEDRILWEGATRDQSKMAPWFLSASAYIYPGAVGLGIIHSLSYGLPVIVHGNAEHQMPEFEVMEDGRTGLLFKENDVDDLALKAVYMIQHPDVRREMGEYSREKVYGEYSMGKMVENFALAINTAHELRA